MLNSTTKRATLRGGFRKVSAASPTVALGTSTALRLKVRCYSTPADLPVPNKSKVWESAEEAVKDVKSGDTLLSGGMFRYCVRAWLRFQMCIDNIFVNVSLYRLRTVWYTRYVPS